jgi:hypothetical protein
VEESRSRGGEVAVDQGEVKHGAWSMGKYGWQVAAGSRQDWKPNIYGTALVWIPDIRRRRIPG